MECRIVHGPLRPANLCYQRPAAFSRWRATAGRRNRCREHLREMLPALAVGVGRSDRSLEHRRRKGAGGTCLGVGPSRRRAPAEVVGYVRRGIISILGFYLVPAPGLGTNDFPLTANGLVENVYFPAVCTGFDLPL